MVVIGTTVPCLHPLAFNFPNRNVQFCNQSPFRLILPPYSFVFKKRITMLSVGPPFLPSTAHFFCSVSSDIPQKAILLMAQMTLSCPVRLRDRLLGPPPLRVRPGVFCAVLSAQGPSPRMARWLGCLGTLCFWLSSCRCPLCFLPGSPALFPHPVALEFSGLISWPCLAHSFSAIDILVMAGCVSPPELQGLLSGHLSVFLLGWLRGIHSWRSYVAVSFTVFPRIF